MLIHDIEHPVNYYGDSAIINHNIANPLTTKGTNNNDSTQYDYWDHLDYVINLSSVNRYYNITRNKTRLHYCHQGKRLCLHLYIHRKNNVNPSGKTKGEQY